MKTFGAISLAVFVGIVGAVSYGTVSMPADTCSNCTAISTGTIVATTSVTSPFFQGSTGDQADSGRYRCANNEACVAVELATPGTDLVFKANATNQWDWSGLQNDGSVTMGEGSANNFEISTSSGSGNILLNPQGNLSVGTSSVDNIFIGRSDTPLIPVQIRGPIAHTVTALTTAATDNALSIASTLNAGAGAGTYAGIKLNVTETNAAGWTTRNLMQLQVGGSDKCTISDAGVVAAANFTATGSINAGTSAAYGFTAGKAKFASSADGQLQIYNNGITSGVTLDVNTNGVLFVKTTADADTATVKTQKYNSTGSTFAALGTPADGTFQYCSDCQILAVCAAVGTGAFAKRLNGAWVCN